MNKFIEGFKKEVKNNKLVYFLLALTLIGGWFVRAYRTDKILGFYFDQGRDALKIWDFWHKGDIMLIGPTTGIAGIFRGPFYYYLIAPFYLLSGGNPVWPALFLAFTSMLAVLLVYYLGLKLHSPNAGLFGAVLASFSFYVMMASRWLSNPTPMLLLSMVLVLMMYLVTLGKKWAWIVIAFVVGLSLFHFGSAGEVFYLPTLIIFAIWQRKNFPSGKILIMTIGAFVFTAVPQILFDLMNGGLLRNNIAKFLLEEKTFKLSFKDILSARLDFYYDVFTNKIFHWRRPGEVFLLSVVAGSFVTFLGKLFKSDGVKILVLLLATPLVGLLFFQGNFGNIYDYYLTGYYLIFILLFAIVLAEIGKYRLGKVFLLFFFLLFFAMNLDVIRYKITDGVDGPNSIGFIAQKRVMDWIYEDAGKQEFNVDVYVPPVIPYAYDYLFKWQKSVRKINQPQEERVNLLYTLYEVDEPHPERLEAWFARQDKIGKIEYEKRFGGIYVQKRTRILY